MRRPVSLSTKLGAIGSVLLLMALASIGLTLWVTWQLEGGAAAVNEAGRMRMQTWRLAQTLAGRRPARLQAQLAQFERQPGLLRRATPSRPLFVPHDARSQQAFADVQQGWQALRARWARSPPPTAGDAAAQAEAFVVRIDAFVIRDRDAAGALDGAAQRLPVRDDGAGHRQRGGAAVCRLPVRVQSAGAACRRGLARVGEGDLSARVEVDSDDEFGALSDGFNRMAQTLQGLYQSLESRGAGEDAGPGGRARAAGGAVRGGGLRRQRRRRWMTWRRASRSRCARVARADASAVRWSDESNQRYLLLASDCLPQQRGRGRALRAHRRLLLRPAAGRGADARHPDPADSADAGMPGHCERAGFETVISVPVRLHERMVGELNLFYRTAATLADEDRALLETLASHLAGAIEGLRAGALEREAAVAEERGLLARELHDSIAQSLSFLKIQVRPAARRA